MNDGEKKLGQTHPDFAKPNPNNESGALSKLWRTVMVERHMATPARFEFFVSRYLEKTEPMNNTVTNLKKRNRASIIKTATATEMSFKSFLELVFNFAGATKIDISVRVHSPNTTEPTVHTITLTNGKSDKNTIPPTNSEDKKEDSK